MKIEVNLGRITPVDYTKATGVSEHDEYDGLEAMRSAAMAHTQFEHELTPQHAVNILLRASLFRFVLSMAVIIRDFYIQGY